MHSPDKVNNDFNFTEAFQYQQKDGLALFQVQILGIKEWLKKYPNLELILGWQKPVSYLIELLD